MHKMIKLASVAVLSMVVASCGGPGDQPVASKTDAANSTDSASAPASATPVANAAPGAFGICKACHAVVAGQNGIGPSLAGVVGRKAGSVAGYAYSEPFRKLDLTWDEASLDKWLTNPMAMAPGTRMSFSGYPEAAKRKAVIDYLKTLK